MKDKKLPEKMLDVDYFPENKKNILEKIFLYLKNPREMMHVVSLNPEIMVEATKNDTFRGILSNSDVQIADGVGIALGSSILKLYKAERITGVDLMQEIIETTSDLGYRIALIGGKPNLAEKISDCYGKRYQKHKFKGFSGHKNIRNYTKKENEEVISIVTDFKPHIIFVAYGSPYQEQWIWENRLSFQGVLCMGVGGAFDFISGESKRAPKVFRKFGIEWLFRLLQEPWRIKRQTNLIIFIYLIFRQKFFSK